MIQARSVLATSSAKRITNRMYGVPGIYCVFSVEVTPPMKAANVSIPSYCGRLALLRKSKEQDILRHVLAARAY